MKKMFLLTAMAVFCFVTHVKAQDDDVYFVPGKQTKQAETPARAVAGRTAQTPERSWYEGRTCKRDVDDYNRRGGASVATADTDSLQDVPEESDGYYTSRLVRFHAPGLVVVASPYYWDYCYDYGWYDPWYGWSWRPWYAGWYGPWYAGWGWGGWYDPWYGPGWGWGWGGWWPGHGPAWGHPAWAWHATPRRGWASGRGGFRGTSNGGYRTTGTRTFAGRGGSSSFGTRTTAGTRPFGTGSRSFGTGTRSAGSRSFGSGTTNRSVSQRRNTRSFDTNRSSSSTRSHTPSYTPSTSSRGGFGGGGSVSSSPSRSGGGFGGGRSFGGGSRGGRR